MRYAGGKAKQANWILGEILKLRGNRKIYLEPFMGACYVLSKVAPHFDYVIGSDIVPDVVEMWQALQSGWIPPQVTEQDHKDLKTQGPSALRAFVGFGCSFGGSWFSKYCGDQLNPSRPIQDQARDACLDKVSTMLHAGLVNCSYEDHRPDSDYVVYCDPPYLTNYKNNRYGAAPKFDHSKFWATMDRWHDNGALVLVSEYSAPGHWRKLSSVSRVQFGNAERVKSGDGKRGVKEEILFTRCVE